MCILQVSTLADHAHVGTCTSAVDLVHELCHSLANTDSELELSVRHFSALVVLACRCVTVMLYMLKLYSPLLTDNVCLYQLLLYRLRDSILLR